VALQDGGSSRCFADEKTVKGFGVKLQLENKDTTTLHGKQEGPSAELDLEVSRDGQTWFKMDDVETYRHLRLPGPELKWTQFVKNNPEFKDVQVEDVSFGDVRLVLGAQLEDQLLPLDEPGCRIKKDGVSAYKTALGWTIGGSMDKLLGVSRNYSVMPEQWEALEDKEVPGNQKQKTSSWVGSQHAEQWLWGSQAKFLLLLLWIVIQLAFMGWMARTVGGGTAGTFPCCRQTMRATTNNIGHADKNSGQYNRAGITELQGPQAVAWDHLVAANSLGVRFEPPGRAELRILADAVEHQRASNCNWIPGNSRPMQGSTAAPYSQQVPPLVKRAPDVHQKHGGSVRVGDKLLQMANLVEMSLH
jgi:hypothetical protein